MYGIGENANHFTTCIDTFLDHISNHKHLDNHMLFYVVFANHNSIYLVIINGTLCYLNRSGEFKRNL